MAGAAILVLLILAALCAPLFFPGDPLSIVSTPLLQPFENRDFIFGTDRLGRDVLAELFMVRAPHFSWGLRRLSRQSCWAA